MATTARVPGCRGRLPADLTRPHLLLSAHLDTAVPPNPVVVDWLSKVPAWPILGNDRWGDCVWAMAAHATLAFAAFGRGSTVEITLADVLKAYHDVTGFDPADPSTDQGTNVQDALKYWRSTGVGGHRILAFARVDHENLEEVRASLNVFGALAVGVNLPAVAEQQFASGNRWDVVTDDGGILGGHAVHLGGYDERAGTFTVTTWGHTQQASENWFRTYVEEIWAVISPEWLSVAGLSPEGLDLCGLGADLAELTGAPNPFPTPAPSPVPADHDGHTVVAEFEAAVVRLLAWLKSHL